MVVGERISELAPRITKTGGRASRAQSRVATACWSPAPAPSCRNQPSCGVSPGKQTIGMPGGVRRHARAHASATRPVPKQKCCGPRAQALRRCLTNGGVHGGNSKKSRSSRLFDEIRCSTISLVFPNTYKASRFAAQRRPAANLRQRAGIESCWSAAAPEIGVDQKLGIVFHKRAIDLHIFEHPLHIIARF
jgi:hypothetical protein